jgi:hypothetical protein
MVIEKNTFSIYQCGVVESKIMGYLAPGTKSSCHGSLAELVDFAGFEV